MLIECRMFQCSNVFFLFIGLQEFLVHWSIGQWVHGTTGPLVECEMSNVNKVKLLSKRNSGVPPVIFVYCSICTWWVFNFSFWFSRIRQMCVAFCLEFTMLVFDCFFIGLVLHSHRGLICFKSLVGLCTFAEAATVPPLTLNLAFLLLPPSGPGIIFFLAKLICGKKDLFL